MKTTPRRRSRKKQRARNWIAQHKHSSVVKPGELLEYQYDSGEIWWADFPIEEQIVTRPVVIISSGKINRKRNTVFALPLSSRLTGRRGQGRLVLRQEESGLPYHSVLIQEHANVLPKASLVSQIGKLSGKPWKAVKWRMYLENERRKIERDAKDTDYQGLSSEST